MVSRPLFILSLLSTFAIAEEVDFAREVLPILSDKCFVCHGPDAEEDELRLDSFDGATVDLGGYHAINLKDPADSELIHRIHDSEDPMPPKKAETQLNDVERDILTRWVKSGGNYAKHWAFVRPEKPKGGKSIDEFVNKRLKTAGHKLAPTASPEVLARRAALVLTGLPPESDQLKQFLSDGNYDALIDDLLKSSRFGEHQARYWLDAVRYGDTHGLHLDNMRGIFPYRDWVVNAFNDNLSFNDFITWQLAGDLLPSPTLSQLTATGYIRMNPTTAEGGAIPAEFQAKNNFDRTENFGTVFLGMTLNCSRCHTHKYDPILHQEYYELLAFFNSTAESPMDGNSYIYAPVLEVPSSNQDWDAWSKLEPKNDALIHHLDNAIALDPKLHDKALAHASNTSKWKTANWKISNSVPLDAPAPTNEKAWKDGKGLPGRSGERLPQKHQARWVQFDLTLPTNEAFLIETNGGPQSVFQIEGFSDPLFGPNHDLYQKAGTYRVTAKLQGTTDGKRGTEFRLRSTWKTLAQHKKWADCSAEDKLLMAKEDEPQLFNADLRNQARALAQELLELQSRFTTTLIAKDLPNQRETKILERGEYHSPVGEALQPGVFAVMNPLPEDAPPNRLGLAQWLTSREHPLTSRVLVNRIWQSVFGEGLVRSPEDFGLQGRQPTHPELLDWLSVNFQEQGWNYKELLKQLVTSQTFRQDSAWRGDLSDPDNLLLGRGPSFRLDAEVIRDTGLWASQLLQTHQGGAGVKPYQPAGMWKALAHPGSNTKLYQADSGDEVFRRSLYVYWKRTSPHPMMTLFDAPSRESSCVRRSRGNTPLQSLGLLNEPQRMEMSRALAGRLLQTAKTDEARLDHLFQLLVCRPPSNTERKACLTLLEQARARYTDNPDDAKLLAKGEDGTADLAAWTQLSSTVLASDLSILLY